MLAISPPTTYGLDHAPHTPSPLSPQSRNRNAFPNIFAVSQAEPTTCKRATMAFSARSRGAATPRNLNPNPLLQRGRDERDRRRGLFLKKVREEGEERKWLARGGEDEVMRSIYLAERRRWEAMQARFASGLEPNEHEEAELEERRTQSMTGTEEHNLANDTILPASDAEIEAEIARSLSELDEWGAGFLENQPRDTDALSTLPTLPSDSDSASASPSLGQHYKSESDDEEYDRLFLEMIDSSSLNGQAHMQMQSLPSPTEWAQMMDDAEMMMDTSGA